VAGVLGQLPQQQELQPGQRDGAAAGVGDQAAHVQGQAASPDGLTRAVGHPVRGDTVRGDTVRGGSPRPDPQPDPGQQLGQRERLGQVVLRAALQARHLGGHVGQAGQHEDGLVRAGGQHPLQDLVPLHPGHDQIQDDQVVAAVPGQPQRVGSAGREVGPVTRRVQRAPDEGTDARLVVGDQNPGPRRSGWMSGPGWMSRV
jgi:hypothetical protein